MSNTHWKSKDLSWKIKGNILHCTSDTGMIHSWYIHDLKTHHECIMNESCLYHVSFDAWTKTTLATRLKISCTFYFVRNLDIGMHYLPSRIQHALLEIQIFEQSKIWSIIFFMDAQVKILCIFISWGTWWVCTIFSEFDTHCNLNGKNLWSTIFYL